LRLSDNQPVVIAEVGSVHDGSFGNAVKLIELAKRCGADFVKFQTHLPQYESTKNAPSPAFFSAEERYEYFLRTGFSADEWRRLATEASKVGIGFMSSVFSVEALFLLIDVGVEHIKIPSGEVTNTRLLREISKLSVSVYLSTGMSNWEEIDAAVEALRPLEDLTIMQCTSAYPTILRDAGVNVVSEMATRYPFRLGFSDHTEGNEAAILAMANGARVFEKHLTFSRLMYGSDASLAREPEEFSVYSQSLKNALEAISNNVDKDDLAPFIETRRIYMKGLYFSRDLAVGSIVQEGDLIELKPCDGISASERGAVLGRTLREPVSAFQPVVLEHF
jgi:N-acetylneuraminate synthase